MYYFFQHSRYVFEINSHDGQRQDSRDQIPQITTVYHNKYLNDGNNTAQDLDYRILFERDYFFKHYNSDQPNHKVAYCSCNSRTVNAANRD